MAATFKALMCVTIGMTGCTVTFNEDLLLDGSRTDLTASDTNEDLDAAPPNDARDLGTDLAMDRGGNDQLTVPDTVGVDLPSVDCMNWNNWTCSMKVMNSVSRCPKTGAQLYSLGCNAGGCGCTNKITLVSKSCSVSSGITCADAQAALASGCCSGI